MTVSGYQRAIEVDFDVWKELATRMESEADTYNDVLRRMLGLGPKPRPEAVNGKGAFMAGPNTPFPAGNLLEDQIRKDQELETRVQTLEADNAGLLQLCQYLREMVERLASRR